MIRTLAVVLLAAAVAGCGNKVARIGPGPELWNSGAVIGVAFAPLPQATTYKHGAQGFLDMAVNEATSSGLNGHLQRMDLSGFYSSCDEIVARLERRGMQVRRVTEPVDPERFPKVAVNLGDHYAQRDYRGLGQFRGFDRLLLLQLANAGTSRNYYGFFPTSDPQGYVRATAQLIDLPTGRILWSAAAERRREVQDEWDQPPGYRNVDAAILEAMRIAARDLANDLSF